MNMQDKIEELEALLAQEKSARKATEEDFLDLSRELNRQKELEKELLLL